AVDGDRSLARDEAREVSGQLDDDVVPARPWRTGADRAHAVDVALDDVAAEAGVDAQGPLEVDARAALERAERRVPQGLGHDVRGEGPIAREARDREAHGRDGDRVPGAGVGGDEGAAHVEAGVRAAVEQLDGEDLADLFDDSGEHGAPSSRGSRRGLRGDAAPRVGASRAREVLGWARAVRGRVAPSRSWRA